MAEISFTPNEPPLAGEDTLMFIHLFDVDTLSPATELDIVHEHKMHVFIIGSDLSTFAHIHPDDIPGGYATSDSGYYMLAHAFPAAGRYAIIVDYTLDSENTLITVPVLVTGQGALPSPERDYSMKKTSGDYTITLKPASRIEQGVETWFDVTIEKGNKKVTDLQMLYGDEMHVTIIRDDLTHVGHIHSYTPGHSVHFGPRSQRYVGPTIPLRNTFPTKGDYALFIQFRHEGKMMTVPFMVQVEEKRTLSAQAIVLPVIALGAAVFVGIWAERVRRNRYAKKDVPTSETRRRRAGRRR